MPLAVAVGLGPGHIVLDGNPSTPPPKRGHSSPPTFWPMSTVAKRLDGSIIKMPLGTEVGLGPGDIALDGDPVPHEEGTAAPTFPPMSIVAKRWPI